MKKLFLTLLIVFSISVAGSAQNVWEKLSSPTQRTLTKVVFVDSLTGWAAGDTGMILHTTNGGKNWTQQNSGITFNIHSLTFSGRQYGWALAWKTDAPPFGTIILKTENGGQSWDNSFYREENVFLTPLHFIDSLNGFAGAGYAGLVYTTDGGKEWTHAEIDSFGGFPKADFAFRDKLNGFACGGTFDVVGVIWKTSNGGRNWYGRPIAPEPIHKLAIRDSMHVDGIGGDFEFGVSTVQTTNNGANWLYKELNVFGIGLGLAFRTPAEGWVTINGGLSGKFLLTTDSAKTWKTYPTPDSIYIMDITFPDSAHGYAVGQLGTILKYRGPLSSIRDEQYEPANFALFQNFPNPFNPETVISYKLETSARVIIRIFDILGREVETLADLYQEQGTHSLKWNAARRPSGIYFCELKTGQLTRRIKMVYTR